jgi:HK97 family phage major capsid protein
MKISKKEFSEQLKLLQTLPAGETRTAMITTLKSAKVYDTDKEGKEIECEIEIVEPTPEQQKAAKDPDADAKMIEQITKDVYAKVRAELKVGQPTPRSQIQPGDAPWAMPKGQFYHVPKHFRGTLAEAQEKAYKFGHWFRAIAGKASSQKWCAEHGIELVMKSAQGEDTNTLGGCLVPTEFESTIIDLREKYGVFRRCAKIEPMARDTKQIPRRVSGLTAYFPGENTAGTESAKVWDLVSLTAKKAMILSRYSSELNEDALINIGDDLAGEIAYAFSLLEDQCGFIGDGTSTYSGIVGVTNKMTNLGGTIAYIAGLVVATGNLFSEFTLADFNAVVGKLPQYAEYGGNGVRWFAHKTFWAGTMQRLALAAGGVQAIEVVNGVTTPFFLGYPTEIAQVLPNTDSNSQISCLFGNMALAACLGDRREITIATTTEGTINGVSMFEADAIGIRGTERFDINVHDIGNYNATAASLKPGPIVGLISASS